MDVVQLNVLPRGDMRDSVGVFLSEFGERLQLRSIQTTGWNLDALHSRRVPHSVGALGEVGGREIQLLDFLPVAAMTVVIALPVGTAAQASLGEQLLIELSLLAQRDLGLKMVDLP